MVGFGFQAVAMYHMEVKSTWFTTRILPAKESRQVLQLINLPLRAMTILLKLASGGRWNPTWIPRYLTPLPSETHWSPTSWPHSQSFSLLLAHIAAVLFQLIFAPNALQNMSRTF